MSGSNKPDWKVFLTACKEGDLLTAQTLVSLQRVDPTVLNNEAILCAARHGHLEVVKFLARLDGMVPAERNNDAILWAAYDGHLDVVEFLATLDGVDPAVYDNFAIRFAARDGKPEIVVTLMPHISNIPPSVVTQDVVDIVVRRATLLSRLKLPAELCYLIGEFTWGPGAGIYFLKDKPIGAADIIRKLKKYSL